MCPQNVVAKPTQTPESGALPRKERGEENRKEGFGNARFATSLLQTLGIGEPTCEAALFRAACYIRSGAIRRGSRAHLFSNCFRKTEDPTAILGILLSVYCESVEEPANKQKKNSRLQKEKNGLFYLHMKLCSTLIGQHQRPRNGGYCVSMISIEIKMK